MTEQIERVPWLPRFMLFWRVMLWASLLVTCYDMARADPALLGSWRGAAIVGLIAIFLGTYELFERSETRRSLCWPTPYRLVLGYLIVQIAVSVLLLHFNSSFVGPLFALMGQVFSALEMRRWPVPLAALMAVLGAPFGMFDALREGDWGSLLGFGFFVATWVGLAIFISLLFHERHQRERLIGDLRAAKEEIERYALQAEDMAVLRERARLGRDMHDTLGHALVLVNVQLEAAQRLYAVDPPRGDAQLEATRALVREAMGTLRQSLANLRAELPSHQHLPAALQSIADEVKARAGLEVLCSAPPELPPLPTAASEALWRVAREALTNVERHAAAGSATLAVEQHGGAIVLRVADDGSGIGAGALARPGHYGIAGMRERVEALGGTLHVGSRPGGGTLVEARVPLPQG